MPLTWRVGPGLCHPSIWQGSWSCLAVPCELCFVPCEFHLLTHLQSRMKYLQVISRKHPISEHQPLNWGRQMPVEICIERPRHELQAWSDLNKSPVSVPGPSGFKIYTSSFLPRSCITPSSVPLSFFKSSPLPHCLLSSTWEGLCLESGPIYSLLLKEGVWETSDMALTGSHPQMGVTSRPSSKSILNETCQTKSQLRSGLPRAHPP